MRSAIVNNFTKPLTILGFQYFEFVDDTNSILTVTHLPSLRILATCFLREILYCGFPPNNAPQPGGKCFLVAFQSNLSNVIVRNQDGRAFRSSQMQKTLGITYGQGFRTAANVLRVRGIKNKSTISTNFFSNHANISDSILRC